VKRFPAWVFSVVAAAVTCCGLTAGIGPAMGATSAAGSHPAAAAAAAVDPWDTAEEVPGSAALNADGNARADSVSCVPTGFCAVGGNYSPSSGSEQAFVDETRTSPTSTSISLSAAKVTYGDEQAEHVSVTVTSPGGTPGGAVAVKSGTSTVCTITLRSGRGQCSLAARQLRTGTHTLVAAYNGNSNFTGSASSRKTLAVEQ
jgi:hypothetical protein